MFWCWGQPLVRQRFQSLHSQRLDMVCQSGADCFLSNMPAYSGLLQWLAPCMHTLWCTVCSTAKQSKGRVAFLSLAVEMLDRH